MFTLQPYRSLPITRRGRPRVSPPLAGAMARRWLSAAAVALIMGIGAGVAGHMAAAVTLLVLAAVLALGGLDSWKARYAEPRARQITAADLSSLSATLRAAAYGSSTLPTPPQLPDRRPRASRRAPAR